MGAIILLEEPFPWLVEVALMFPPLNARYLMRCQWRGSRTERASSKNDSYPHSFEYISTHQRYCTDIAWHFDRKNTNSLFSKALSCRTILLIDIRSISFSDFIPIDLVNKLQKWYQSYATFHFGMVLVPFL
jgi:hypothetical protein